MKYIILISLIAIYFAYKACECSQLNLQYDCSLNPGCFWNGTCNIISCTDIPYPNQCISNKGCFYNNNACHNLTNCTDVLGDNANECAQQSLLCASYDDTNKTCQQFTPQPCENYTSQYDCIYTGQNQLCVWDQTFCTNFSCSLLNKFQCPKYSEYCTLITNTTAPGNYSCVDATCESKPTSDCTLTMTYGENSKIQPCYVDTTSNPAKCRDADLSDLNYVNCGINTFFTAAWTSRNYTEGYCKSCFDTIIQLGILLMIFH